MSVDGNDLNEDRLREVCLDRLRALQAAGVKTEKLAVYVAPSRLFGVFPRAATMRPIGEVWRLGTLLLDTNGELWAAGSATRAAERGRVGYQSVSREERKDFAAAAFKGGYPVGTAVNYDAKRLQLDRSSLQALEEDSPIGVSAGQVRVRWRAGAPLDVAMPLEQYLRERSELLINPPLGAS